MSVLIEVLKAVVTSNNSSAGNTAAPQSTQGDVLITAAMTMLDKAGGIQGVMEKFRQSGLDDIVASWVGTGQNKAITPDQISNVLGQNEIQVIAQQANIPAAQGSDILSKLLPALIDSLTPEGKVPEQGQLMSLGKTILSGLAASGMFSGQNKA